MKVIEPRLVEPQKSFNNVQAPTLQKSNYVFKLFQNGTSYCAILRHAFTSYLVSAISVIHLHSNGHIGHSN